METELRLKDMDACGIRHAILSLTSPGAQSILDAAAATHFVTRTNDYIAEYFVQPHPDRFSAFATVALQNPQAAADELERSVKKLGMKGALINGYTNMNGTEEGRYLDDPAVEVFWQKVSELNVPVICIPGSHCLPPVEFIAAMKAWSVQPGVLQRKPQYTRFV